ncbi:MAG TPA: DoxX family protein [Vicinamibacterales bacterium]
MSDEALLLGRLLFGGLFVYNGLSHFRNRAATAAYCAYKHVPAPAAATVLSGAWLLVSGLSIGLGVRPHAGALMVVVFLLGVTPVMHNFWTIADETQRLSEFVNFSKNVALLGAALMSFAIPSPWPYSVVP